MRSLEAFSFFLACGGQWSTRWSMSVERTRVLATWAPGQDFSAWNLLRASSRLSLPWLVSWMELTKKIKMQKAVLFNSFFFSQSLFSDKMYFVLFVLLLLTYCFVLFLISGAGRIASWTGFLIYFLSRVQERMPFWNRAADQYMLFCSVKKKLWGALWNLLIDIWVRISALLNSPWPLNILCLIISEASINNYIIVTTGWFPFIAFFQSFCKISWLLQK